MKVEEGLKVLERSVIYCNSQYCMRCSKRNMCTKVFGNSFVSQEFLNLVKKCESVFQNNREGATK